MTYGPWHKDMEDVITLKGNRTSQHYETLNAFLRGEKIRRRTWEKGHYIDINDPMGRCSVKICVNNLNDDMGIDWEIIKEPLKDKKIHTKENINNEKLIEAISETIHNQWERLALKYMRLGDMPGDVVERWNSFMVEYKELPEHIKDIDRQCAIEILQTIRREHVKQEN